jgi:hypothetical protein
MKLLFVILFIFNGVSLTAFGQTEQINRLITERRSLYLNYEQALDQKSGFFGKQNKADLADLNKILKEIIKKDNQILDEIESQTNDEYDKLQIKYNELIQENDKLTAKNKAIENKLAEAKTYQKANHNQIERATGDKYLWLIVSMLLLLVLGSLFMRQKVKNKKLIQLIKKMERDSA